MNEEDFLVGRCCKKESNYLVHYNGNPSGDYVVYLCNNHLNKPPFDKHILKIEKLEEN